MKNNYDNNSSNSTTLQPSDFTTKQAYQNYLASSHHSLVKTLARNIQSKFGNSYRVSLNDLISAGDEALVGASRAFNPDKGVPFGAYARTVIMRAMRKELFNLLPVDLKSSSKTDYISFNYGKAFDDYVFNPSDSNDMEDDYSAPNEGFDLLSNWDEEEAYMKERLTYCIQRLSPEDRDIVESHYGFNGEPMTFKQLGEQRRVSLQAVNKKAKRIEKTLFDSLSRCA